MSACSELLCQLAYKLYYIKYQVPLYLRQVRPVIIQILWSQLSEKVSCVFYVFNNDSNF